MTQTPLVNALCCAGLMGLISCTPTAARPVTSDASPGSADPSATSPARPDPPAAVVPAPATTPNAAAVGPLPGSVLAIAQARGASRSVVVAKIAGLGTPSPGPPMEQQFDGASAVVVRTLSGEQVEGNIALFFDVKLAPAAPVSEHAPREGEEYVLFLAAPRAGGRRVIKMLAATRENVAAAAGRD